MKKICFSLLLIFMIATNLFSGAMVPGEFPPSPPPSEEPEINEGERRDPEPDNSITLVEAQKELTSIDSGRIALGNKAGSFTTGGTTGARGKAHEKTSALNGTAAQATTNPTGKIEDSKKKVNTEAASKKSDKSGDPVKISKGTYEMSETDFETGNIHSIQIKRRYESDNKITGSFGYGWTTNLDERIILGTDADYQNEIRTLNYYIYEINNTIAELERSLAAAYKVSSIYKAKDEISAQIKSCDALIKEADDLIGRGETLEVDAVKHLAIVALTQICVERIQEIKTDLNSKRTNLKAIYDLIDGDLAEIDYMKKQIDEKQDRLSYILELQKEVQAISDRNKNVLFEGMGDQYQVVGSDSLVLIDEDGYPHIFKKNEKNPAIWNYNDGTEYLYCEQIGQCFKLFGKHGIVKDFDASGFIVKITDNNLNTINIVRDSAGKIICVENSFGEKLSFDYDGRSVAKITNVRSPDETVIYQYNNKKLVSVKDSEDDVVSMSYDSDGRMIQLKKCDGSFVTFCYGEQSAAGEILTTATVNEEGAVEQFVYDRSGKKTEYYDHDGNKTVYYFDDNQRTIKKSLPDGAVLNYGYDTQGNMTYQNENGVVTNYSYDDKGNLISVLYEDGSKEKYDYDDYGFLISYKDRDELIENYVRDNRGNLIEFHRGGKNVYSQQVDSHGFVKSQTLNGQNPVKTDYYYDSHGNLLSKTTGDIKQEYEYDGHNRVIKESYNKIVLQKNHFEKHKIETENYQKLKTTYITNGRKDLVEVIQKDMVTGVIHKTRVEYDKRHLPLKVFTGDCSNEKLITSYTYTLEGKLKSVISHGEESWVKLYEYKNGEVCGYKQFKTNTDLTVVEPVETTAEDGTVYIQKFDSKLQNKNRKLLTVTDDLGINTLFEYDSYGNLIKTIDGEGGVTCKKYTKQGLLISEQSYYGGWYEYSYTDGMLTNAREENKTPATVEYYPDGSLKSQTDRYGKVIYYIYDNHGRLKCIQSESKKTWYEYDNLDRITKQIVGNSPDENNAIYYVTYDYSPDGRNVTVTEGGRYKTENTFDAFGNIIKQTDGNNNEKSFVYDSQNRMTEFSDGYGNKTTYEYNALGKVSKISLPEGAVSNYKYNHIGLLEEITDDCGTVYKASYDKAGRLIKERYRADSEKQYEYDKAGRITKVLCGGEVVESYSYEANGRTVTYKDGNGNDYLYHYDSFGRLKNEKNRNNLEQNYYYDEEGQLKSQTDFSGESTSIIYSSDRTVRTVSYSDGSENRFEYDAVGKIISAQNAYGKTLYQYDRGGRLIYQKDDTTGEEVHFEYDDAGNRTKLYSTNRETLYYYGKNNEVKEIFDNKQRLSIKLSYNKNGQEVLRKFGNGTKEEILYDKAGRITVKVQKNERGELLWGEGYVYGSDGKRTATVDNEGKITLYEYNAKGQLETVYYPYSQNELAATAEATENRYLTSSEKSAVIPLLNSMQYGLAYQLSNLQVFVKENYTYDKNGNRISKTTPYGKTEYHYDKENCLLSSGSRGEIYVSYTYDKIGNLLTEESSDKTVKYAYNSQNRMIYCEVLDKTKKSYAQTTYAYDAFGRRVIVQDKDEAVLRTLYDGLTFDVIKQSPSLANGLFTDSNENGIRWDLTGRPTGDRYRYLDEDDSKDNNRYFYLDTGSFKTTNARYHGERIQLSVNGSLAAQTTTDYGVEYFTTDLLGSIRTTTDGYGTPKSSVSYDAFGSLLQGELSGTTDHGYLGKQNDPTTNLYNYGYRDYNTQSSRFTTIDPLRDGPNWFLYCNADPINFIDPDGFFYYSANGQEAYKKTTVYVIRNNDGTGNEFDSSVYIKKEDVFGNVNYSDPYVVGANCRQEYLDEGLGSTTPDGTYYLTAQGTYEAPLYKQSDDTTNSTSYKNVLSLRTKDQNLTQAQRDMINVGDRLLHADETYNKETEKTEPYNRSGTPGGAGCIINHTQSEHDKMMSEILRGVPNPESVSVKIYSLNNMGCTK